MSTKRRTNSCDSQKQVEDSKKWKHDTWKTCHTSQIPNWLNDNEFLLDGHRPQLRSFKQCFGSIFRLHSETGNIWSHLIGCVYFIGLAGYFLIHTKHFSDLQEKLTFTPFFVGAICCLGFSFIFHTVHCRSKEVSKAFNKLDYGGISCMIVGSYVPWLFYGFYCRKFAKYFYISSISVLGLVCLIVSLKDKFATAQFRPLRAGLYIGLGLCGVIPAVHLGTTGGYAEPEEFASLKWLILMGATYIAGALLYAGRVPERFFPGKCDLWFQSHQIFHLMVLAGAMVHYHGTSEIASFRLSQPTCLME